jgi:hypothetical protein
MDAMWRSANMTLDAPNEFFQPECPAPAAMRAAQPTIELSEARIREITREVLAEAEAG